MMQNISHFFKLSGATLWQVESRPCSINTSADYGTRWGFC